MRTGKSAAAAALVLFLAYSSPARASMPLTETIATLPEGGLELILREDFYTHCDGYRRETAGLSIGALPSFTLSFYFHYLHRGIARPEESLLGDVFLRLWLYGGDYWNNTLHLGFLGLMRFPTGVNAYRDGGWHGLALGNNELKLGPVAQKDIDGVFLHVNLFYVFRERDREGFYNRLYVNPLEGVTYEKVFGLNPSAKDAFLESSRLSNDYLIASVAVNSDRFYPVIPYAEVYGSFRPDRKRMAEDDLNIEGGAVNPLMLSAGARYFFSDSVYAGFYIVSSLVKRSDYLKEIAGIEASLWF